MNEALQREITKCSRCGKCRSVCPVFIETKTEGMVARGRISLAEAYLKGGIRDTAKLRRYIYGCLKCMRCADGCPSGVRFDKIIAAARHELGGKAGIPWLARLGMRAMLARRWAFDLAVRAAAVAEKVLPRRAGKMRHLPLIFGDGRGLPEIAPKSVLNSFDDYYGPKDAERKVALFLGCLVNYAYPEIARAIVKVLNATGAGVYIPKGQVCCGAPPASLGDDALVAKLARTNAEAFRGARHRGRHRGVRVGRRDAKGVSGDSRDRETARRGRLRFQRVRSQARGAIDGAHQGARGLARPLPPEVRPEGDEAAEGAPVENG